MKTSKNNMIPQTIPENLTPKELEDYATSFFGYGSWDVHYWLIGIEERGAAEKNEFINRFEAWKKKKPDLADLRDYSKESGISLDEKKKGWKNRTWGAIHKMLPKEIGEKIGRLGPENEFWGGAKNVKKGSGHVALIEAMPFPAKGTHEWPYEEWDFEFMKERENCKEKFLPQRVKIIMEKIKERQPKFVIDYGNVWEKTPKRDGFSKPTLFRRSEIGETLWVSPIRINRNFDRVAKEQTSGELSHWLNSK